MNKMFRAAVAAVAVMSASQAAMAAGFASRVDDTTAFVGVSWNFTKSKPAFQAGIRSLTIRCASGNDGLVTGWQLAADLDMQDGFDKLRLDGVYGHADDDALATYGVGYSLAEKSFFGGVAAQGSRVFGRFDYSIGGAGATGFSAGLNTLSKPAECWGPV